MRLTIGLALVMVLGAAACKKSTTTVASTGSGGSAGSAPAIAAGSSTAGGSSATQTIDAAARPWQMPAGTSAGSGDADATSLGNVVVAHFVERISKLQGAEDYRDAKLLLVLEGAGKGIVADETNVYAQDGGPSAMAIKSTSDVLHPPLTPPRPYKDSDADPGVPAAFDFKGPLLFLVRLNAKAENRVIAVGKDQDALVVWSLVIPSDSVDVPPEWEKTGTIKLAPGATVTGAGAGS